MVILRRGHCAASAHVAGMVGTVAKMHAPGHGEFCGACGSRDVPPMSTWVMVRFGSNEVAAPRAWLTVISPPANMVDEQHSQEVTA